MKNENRNLRNWFLFKNYEEKIKYFSLTCSKHSKRIKLDFHLLITSSAEPIVIDLQVIY